MVCVCATNGWKTSQVHATKHTVSSHSRCDETIWFVARLHAERWNDYVRRFSQKRHKVATKVVLSLQSFLKIRLENRKVPSSSNFSNTRSFAREGLFFTRLRRSLPKLLGRSAGGLQRWVLRRYLPSSVPFSSYVCSNVNGRGFHFLHIFFSFTPLFFLVFQHKHCKISWRMPFSFGGFVVIGMSYKFFSFICNFSFFFI